MTHDKLLFWIDEALNWYGDQENLEEAVHYIKAVRAVVELHTPSFAIVNGVKGDEWCYQCADQRSYARYPCPTIQAIEKELA